MISLVICTYNRCNYIYTTLERVAKNDYPKNSYEIVLVNNNSTDDTESECQRFAHDYPSVPLRYLVETKQGLSNARNRGIEESRGDMVVFLDDDAFVTPDYLRTLAQYMVDLPDMDAFGGRISPLFESGVTPPWFSKWTYSWVSALDRGDTVSLFEGNTYPIGANMGVRKKCFERIGVFNPELGRSKKNMMAGEEKDLFNRLKSSGYHIYYLPAIPVKHVIPPQRTTDEYIVRLAEGVGMSEQLRTRNISKTCYHKRLFSEAMKWAGTLVLATGFLLRRQKVKGRALILFRKHVTRGLLRKGQ